jgi:uncharacterized RDD family membrane protein YckC
MPQQESLQHQEPNENQEPVIAQEPVIPLQETPVFVSEEESFPQQEQELDTQVYPTTVLYPIATQSQPIAVPVFRKAPLFRRLAADIIDGIIPLPFIATFFPVWVVVPILYALFCDSQGASVGKKLLGLSVVCCSKNPNQHGTLCNTGRSVLRNVGYLVGALCTLSAVLSPLGIGYNITEAILVWFRKDGRRLGDLLAGTQVVLTEELRRNQ